MIDTDKYTAERESDTDKYTAERERARKDAERHRDGRRLVADGDFLPGKDQPRMTHPFVQI